jgi:hypothetical protein
LYARGKFTLKMPDGHVEFGEYEIKMFYSILKEHWQFCQVDVQANGLTTKNRNHVNAFDLFARKIGQCEDAGDTLPSAHELP